MRGKTGKSDLATIIIFVLIAGVAAYAFDFGGFQTKVDGWVGDSGSQQGGNEILATDNCPSDGVTTLTLYTPDKLASTATNVVTEYYIFDGDQLVTSGTNTGSSASIALTCGKDFKVQLLNSTATAGAYGQIVDVKTRQAKQSLTVPMVQMGGATILSIQNPADPSRNSNVSLVAGATKNFEIKFAANVTQKGYNNPIVMCQANVSSIQSVSIGSFSDGTTVGSVTALPKRVSATAGYVYYAFEYGKLLNPTVGVITAVGSITASSTTPYTGDSMTCILVDQATWKASNYQSVGLAAGFKTGAENTETNSEIGARDSNTATYYFSNTGGY